jgi:transcription initiation factor TFIIB
MNGMNEMNEMNEMNGMNENAYDSQWSSEIICFKIKKKKKNGESKTEYGTPVKYSDSGSLQMGQFATRGCNGANAKQCVVTDTESRALAYDSANKYEDVDTESITLVWSEPECEARRSAMNVIVGERLKSLVCTLCPLRDMVEGVKEHIKHPIIVELLRLPTGTTEFRRSPSPPARSTSQRVVQTGSSKKTTKKKQISLSSVDKSKLWDIFDNDKQAMRDNHTQNDRDLNRNRDNGLECIYQQPPSAQMKESGLCTLCSSVLMIMEDGFPTCTSPLCSIIYKNTLDYSPEWRFYGADDKNTADPTRCGNPINPLLVESSYGCKVLCTPKSSYEMKKIRKWTEWQSMPHREKSLYDEFQFITIMAHNAGIPKIFIDDAMVIHKDISEQKMFRGLNRDGIKAASIYISCRLNGCPRTAHEIAEIFRLDKTSATGGCSMAVNILHNIERNIDPSQQTDLCTTTPSSFIERYCSRLNINPELTMLSTFIARKIEQNNIISDNTPHSIAAGIIYFISQSCNLNITKIDIKQICGVSEVTINKCFKKMELIKHMLIPNCIIDKYQ